MKKEDLFSIFKVDDIRLLPEAIMPVVISNSYERDDIYRELLELNNHDVSHDWFQSLYEGEFSERKEKKQDFTPNSLGSLSSMITGVLPAPTPKAGLPEEYAAFTMPGPPVARMISASRMSALVSSRLG